MGCILLYARAYDDRHLHTHLNGNFPKSHLLSPTHPAAVYIDNDPTLTDDA